MAINSQRKLKAYQSMQLPYDYYSEEIQRQAIEAKEFIYSTSS